MDAGMDAGIPMGESPFSLLIALVLALTLAAALTGAPGNFFAWLGIDPGRLGSWPLGRAATSAFEKAGQ